FGGAAGSALLRDDVTGTAQFVVDRSARTLLGATFVGPEASEMLHAATVAIVGQVPGHVLRHAVPSFPTASELWLQLLESLPRELRGLWGSLRHGRRGPALLPWDEITEGSGDELCTSGGMGMCRGSAAARGPGGMDVHATATLPPSPPRQA